MVLRMVVGLVLTAVAFAVAGRRVWWLGRLAFSGQPAPERLEYARRHPGREAETQLTEVIGQRKLLRWSIPGAAHAGVFWGFLVLLLTIIEAYGALFQRDFAIPVIGKSAAVGLIEDIFAVAVLVALAVFTVIRLANSPARLDRRSRFYGSHVDQAFIVLGMIFLVIATLLLYRGAQISAGYFPYQDEGWWAFASKATSYLTPNSEAFETVFIVAQIAVVMGFLVLVLYSKHMHIFTAPLNVFLKRQPKALGALEIGRAHV